MIRRLFSGDVKIMEVCRIRNLLEDSIIRVISKIYQKQVVLLITFKKGGQHVVVGCFGKVLMKNLQEVTLKVKKISRKLIGV